MHGLNLKSHIDPVNSKNDITNQFQQAISQNVYFCLPV